MAEGGGEPALDPVVEEGVVASMVDILRDVRKVKLREKGLSKSGCWSSRVRSGMRVAS